MSYYAVLTPAFIGHLNPMIVLARALQRRGHRIAFISPLDAEAKVREAGFEFIPIATAGFPRGEWERTTVQMGELTGFKASRFAGNWLGRFAQGILRELAPIAARERFDGLVMDQVSIGTESACEVIGLPMAVACCALIFHTESAIPPGIFSWSCRTAFPFRVRNVIGQLIVNSTGWRVLWEVAPFRFKHRLPLMKFHHVNEMCPSLVQVSQQPAFFDFPRAHLPDNFHYTGPWILEESGHNTDFPWHRLDGRPLIYASLGTLQNRLERVFRIIAEACAGLDAQLVIALGCKTARVPSNLPGDPIVVGYAPQMALLRRATLVITHGGLNTTLECLSEGLPLVALPITNDQPGVAARIKYLGAGEFIPVKKLTAPELRRTVRSVQTSPFYRERALRWADEIKRADGPARAAELIEKAFSTRQRVQRSSASTLPPRSDAAR